MIAGQLANSGLEPELCCALPGGGQVLFTTRRSGNLSHTQGAGHQRAEAARERLRDQLGLSELRGVRQVHGARVLRLAEGGDRVESDSREADGQATTLAGLGTIALAADCLPVALGSERAVAILHAGWRGLLAGVLEEGVRALREVGGRGAIVAAIGPGAGVCCYEVGPEVRGLIAARHRAGSQIDLRAIARERLLSCGVSRVCEVRACTICDERFFSHRREGERAGRQGAVGWLS